MIKKIIAGATAGLAGTLLFAGLVFALVGDLLDTVGLPGNDNCSVAGTFTGTYYMTMEGGFAVGCAGNQLQIYTPPAPDVVPGLPPDPATLVSTQTVLDAGGNAVNISALAWDPTRNKVWGAYDDNVYLIDIVDPTVDGNATATLQFSPSVNAPVAEVDPFDLFGKLPGITLVDGLAYDGNDDTVWYTPDVHCNVYHFASDGTYIGKVTPENAAGNSDCSVSGVVVGSANSLYIGRNGNNEIRRVDKTTGDFISNFATTAGRVEDLTCDPVTYAPKEAVLAKDAFNVLYEAFEVEEGTCPLPEPKDETPPKAACTETVNPHGATVPPAGKTTLPGPRGGDNEDGFYELFAADNLPGVTIWVSDAFGSGPFGPFLPGDKVKITEAPGGPASSKAMGSSNGQAGAILTHITLLGDALITAIDAAGNATVVSCLVPPPPK